MPKPRRYYFVGSKRTRTLHLSHHITEGYRTICGVMIGLGTWKWARTPAAKAKARRAQLCKKCLKAAPPGIIVQRVRR